MFVIGRDPYTQDLYVGLVDDLGKRCWLFPVSSMSHQQHWSRDHIEEPRLKCAEIVQVLSSQVGLTIEMSTVSCEVLGVGKYTSKYFVADGKQKII